MASSPDKEGFWKKQKEPNKIYYFKKNKKGKYEEVKNQQLAVTRQVEGKKKTYHYGFDRDGFLIYGNRFYTFTKSDGKTKKTCYFGQYGQRYQQAKKTINGTTYYFNTNTGELTGRINKLTYIHQRFGVRQNGKWNKHERKVGDVVRGFPDDPVYNYSYPDLAKYIRDSGCGITSCAMICTALTNKLVLPSVFNTRDFNQPTQYFNGRGSNIIVGNGAAKKYGLKSKIRSFTKEQMIKQLFNGGYILCWVNKSIYGALGNNAGGNTGSGGSHYILIHGYRDGKFAVADPNNTSQSYVMSSPHKLQSFESFNSHLANGPTQSYVLITKK